MDASRVEGRGNHQHPGDHSIEPHRARSKLLPIALIGTKWKPSLCSLPARRSSSHRASLHARGLDRTIREPGLGSKASASSPLANANGALQSGPHRGVGLDRYRSRAGVAECGTGRSDGVMPRCDFRSREGLQSADTRPRGQPRTIPKSPDQEVTPAIDRRL
jgi:hypothetical protein